MAEYTVDVTIETNEPLTEDRLFAVAAIGGAAAGPVGALHLETTLTIEARSLLAACERGMQRILELAPGEVVGIGAMTTEEADRRLDEGPLVGVAEIADMLHVSKQRASTLTRRRDFPQPAMKLARRNAWRRDDVVRFQGGWQRLPGRPRAQH